MFRERERVNDKMDFPLPQSVQRTIPGHCEAPHLGGTSPWQGSPGAPWWAILVGPAVFPNVPKLHLFFWVCSQLCFHSYVPADSPDFPCPPVPCKSLLSITWPLRSPCPGSLCSLMIFSSLPIVLFSTAVSIRLFQ